MPRLEIVYTLLECTFAVALLQTAALPSTIDFSLKMYGLFINVSEGCTA